MTEVTIQTEPVDGVKSLVVESDKLDDCIRFSDENQDTVPGLIISNFQGYDSADIDFLSDMPWIRKLQVVDDYKGKDSISNLVNLESLQAHNADGIDFTKLKKLKDYSGAWPSQSSFYECGNIESLYLFKGRNQAQLEALRQFSNLRNLSIIRSQFESLDGVSGLKSLQELEVAYCSKLTSINDLFGNSSIKNITFENCSKIGDFSVLSSIDSLEKVFLEKCGTISDIKFCTKLKNLRMFIFYGTSLESKDPSPLIECKSLTAIGFNSKKDYTLNEKEVMRELGLE